jgi:hypothetical protein
VQCFGKHGVSLLGAMLVKCVESDGKIGLEYVFFYCLVERDSIQDNMQVPGVLTSLLPLMKTQYPDINEISVLSLSNNASCLFGVTRFHLLDSPFEQEAGRFEAQRARDDWRLTFIAVPIRRAVPFIFRGEMKGVRGRNVT